MIRIRTIIKDYKWKSSKENWPILSTCTICEVALLQSNRWELCNVAILTWASFQVPVPISVRKFCDIHELEICKGLNLTCVFSFHDSREKKHGRILKESCPAKQKVSWKFQKYSHNNFPVVHMLLIEHNKSCILCKPKEKFCH